MTEKVAVNKMTKELEMPDEVKDVQTTDEGDTQAPPTPDISAGSVPASSEKIGFDADAFQARIFEKLDNIEESLPDLIDRRFKSDKDKRFVKLARADEILAAVEASGGDPEKIRGKLESDALLNRIEALESARGAGGTVPAEDAETQKLQADSAELLQKARAEHGVEITDEELTELMGTQARWTGPEWLNAISSSVIKKAKQGNIGDGVSAGSSGTAVLPTDDDELLGRIMELQRHPVQNAAEVKKLNAEARKRGLLK